VHHPILLFEQMIGTQYCENFRRIIDSASRDEMLLWFAVPFICHQIMRIGIRKNNSVIIIRIIVPNTAGP